MSYLLKSNKAAPFQLEQSSLGACVGYRTVGGNGEGDNNEGRQELSGGTKGREQGPQRLCLLKTEWGSGLPNDAPPYGRDAERVTHLQTGHWRSEGEQVGFLSREAITHHLTPPCPSCFTFHTGVMSVPASEGYCKD